MIKINIDNFWVKLMCFGTAPLKLQNSSKCTIHYVDSEIIKKHVLLAVNHDVLTKMWLQTFATTTSVMKYDNMIVEQTDVCWIHFVNLKDVLHPSINVCATLPCNTHPLQADCNCSTLHLLNSKIEFSSSIHRISTRWVKSSTLPETNSSSWKSVVGRQAFTGARPIFRSVGC